MNRADMPLLGLAARREQLRLLCALDRARLRLLLSPPKTRSPDWTGLARKVAGALLPRLLPLAPGMLGQWARHLARARGLSSN